MLVQLISGVRLHLVLLLTGAGGILISNVVVLLPVIPAMLNSAAGVGVGSWRVLALEEPPVVRVGMPNVNPGRGGLRSGGDSSSSLRGKAPFLGLRLVASILLCALEAGHLSWDQPWSRCRFRWAHVTLPTREQAWRHNPGDV